MINLTHNHTEDDKINDKIWKNVPAVYHLQEIVQIMNLYPSHRRPIALLQNQLCGHVENS
jgi:hypothetical protein